MSFETLTILLSSILIAVFSIIFRYELRRLKEMNSLAEFSPLALKIIKLLTIVYRNFPSAFIALSRLNPSCQLINPSFKPLARSFSLSGVNPLKLSVTPSLVLLCLNPHLKEEAIVMCLFQESVRGARKKFLATNIKSITTLVLTGIIISPVPITLLALFHQSSMLNLLPLIASLFYGIFLQLVLLVLKRYMRLLV